MVPRSPSSSSREAGSPLSVGAGRRHSRNRSARGRSDNEPAPVRSRGDGTSSSTLQTSSARPRSRRDQSSSSSLLCLSFLLGRPSKDFADARGSPGIRDHVAGLLTVTQRPQATPVLISSSEGGSRVQTPSPTVSRLQAIAVSAPFLWLPVVGQAESPARWQVDLMGVKQRRNSESTGGGEYHRRKSRYGSSYKTPPMILVLTHVLRTDGPSGPIVFAVSQRRTVAH